MQFINSASDDELFILMEKVFGSQESEPDFFTKQNRDELLNAVFREDEESRAEPGRLVFIRRFKYVAAAAVFLIVSTLGILYYRTAANAEADFAKVSTQSDLDIAPGGNKAVLTLSDGSQVVLDDKGLGAITEQSGMVITKKADGEIVYRSKSSEHIDFKGDPPHNTVSTPAGGQFQVVLPDGTKAWLNAASQITFPVKFTKGERKVKIAGEVYFEVANNKRLPFRVLAANQTIEVLGTHFDVMAYEDEPNIKTTLLEGSVKVTYKGMSKVLEPGQQSRAGKGSSLDVSFVNTEDAVAWKNGYFMFNNESLESIMRKVSKWYNVDVHYEGRRGNLNFGGMVSRSKNIGEVLKIMELTGKVKFKLIPAGNGGEKRRLVVML